MKFIRLKIKNFLTIGDAAPLTLDGKGLVLIQGVNEDDSSATSNGVGKSSIPDALCWALFGETARGESGDAVVNNIAKKDCSVSVTIQDGSSFYRITRYRKHKEFKNQTTVEATSEGSEAGSWVDLSKGTEKETQELIIGIVGCSIDVFMASIYAGQEEMPDLPRMTDKQLKLLIEEASGVERLESAYVVAREQWSAAKTKLDKLMGDKGVSEGYLSATKVTLETKRIEVRNFEETRSTRAESHLNEAQRHRAGILDLAAQVKTLKEEELTKEMSALDERLSGHSRIVAGEREHERLLSEAQRALALATSAHENALNQARKIKTLIDNAPAEMKKPCPECGKPHTDDELAEYVAIQRRKLEECIAVVQSAKAGATSAAAACDAAHKKLDEYRREMPDITTVSARKREIASVLGQVSDMKGRMAVLKRDFDYSKERAETVRTEPNPYLSAVQTLEDTVAGTEKTISDLEAKIDAVREEVEIAESCVKVFGPAGVRAHILDSVTPFLNSRTSEYLSALSDGNISAVWSTLSTTAKGELKEKFNIEVENSKGGKSFKLLSGGEKRKVRLATMLALQDLVASRATKPIDLWIGDEIDDALDSAGLERLMSVLEGKARERGTVLVVSHNELRDWIDDVVTVTKKGGTSSIEGALCLP